jgi:hypothetical protein
MRSMTPLPPEVRRAPPGWSLANTPPRLFGFRYLPRLD